MAGNKKLLMLVPYSIDVMNSAPAVRAYNMYNALKEEMPATLICGSKWERALLELRQAFKREPVAYVYIEAMGSDLTLCDHLFLNCLKRRGVLLFPFIRDLYWRFPGMVNRKYSSSKVAAFKRSVRAHIRLYDEKELKYYLRNATALLFPSLLMADTIDFPKKYALPPGGDASRCLNPELPQNKNITFVGGISPKMGIDILMEAMAIVVKECPEAHCTIVGHGDEEIINRWKDKKYVTFLTNKIHKDIPEILSNAYAVAIPRPGIPHNNFAMPLKLFDYMSCARPIIATNCTAMANFITENDIGIITNDNPESLAKGILKLLNSRDLAIKYGRNALSAIQNKHSWKHSARALIEIMQKY